MRIIDNMLRVILGESRYRSQAEKWFAEDFAHLDTKELKRMSTLYSSGGWSTSAVAVHLVQIINKEIEKRKES